MTPSSKRRIIMGILIKSKKNTAKEIADISSTNITIATIGVILVT